MEHVAYFTELYNKANPNNEETKDVRFAELHDALFPTADTVGERKCIVCGTSLVEESRYVRSGDEGGIATLRCINNHPDPEGKLKDDE